MPVFRDPKRLQQHLKKAMDALQAEVLITTQAELGSTEVSPVDTGRFRSNWFAAESVSSSETTEATNQPQTNADSLKVDSAKDYHLTNNLPYAQAISIEGEANRVKSKPTTWFKEFRDQRIPKIQEQAARQIKREFDL